MTAAHCSISTDDPSLQLSIGSNIENTVEILSVHRPPSYRSDNGVPVDDILVVEFQSGGESITSNVVALNTNASLPNLNTELFVSGYGRISIQRDVDDKRANSQTLRTVRVPFVPYQQCRTPFASVHTKTALCAGGKNMDACQGDSGGPLWGWVRNERNESTVMLFGVVSYGTCNAHRTTVYARCSQQAID